MVPSTPGAETLRAYFDAERGRQSAVARQLDVSQAAVSAWASCGSRPEPAYREALELLLGIPARAWETDEDRAIVERARTAASDATGAA